MGQWKSFRFGVSALSLFVSVLVMAVVAGMYGSPRVEAAFVDDDRPDPVLALGERGRALDHADLEVGSMLRHLALELDFLGHVALDAEVTDDAPLIVVQTDVVALDDDRRAVETSFVGVQVKLAAVEELAPHPAALPEVVAVKVLWCQPDERLPPGAVLRKHRVVHLRDALVGKYVVQQPFLVDTVVPPNPPPPDVVTHPRKTARKDRQ